MDWNIAELFPHCRNQHKALTIQVLGRSIWRGPRYHYQQFEHRLSGGHVLQHAQDERIPLYLLQSCSRLGELIYHMVCWKEICRFPVMESCSQNSTYTSMVDCIDVIIMG